MLLPGRQFAFFVLGVLGLVAFCYGRPKQPQDKFQKATQLSNAGSRFSEAGQFEKALKKFQAVLKYRRTVFDLHNVGQTLLRIGRNQDATKVYKDAIKLEPTNDRLLINAASAFVTAGNKKLGLKYYKKAWKISKRGNELYGYNYAIALMPNSNGRVLLNEDEARQMRKAIKVLKQVTRLNPKFSEVYWKLGIAYSAFNKHSKASDYYREALKLHSSGHSRRLRVGEAYYDLHDSLLGLLPKPDYYGALVALEHAVSHEEKNGVDERSKDVSFKYLKYSCALLHLMKYTASYQTLGALEQKVYSLLRREMNHSRNLKSKAMTPMRALGGGMDGTMVHDLLHIWSKSIVDNYAQDHKKFKRQWLDKQQDDIGAFGTKNINIGFVSADFGSKHPMMHLLDRVIPQLRQRKYVNLFLFSLTEHKRNFDGVLSQQNLAKLVSNTTSKRAKSHFLYIHGLSDFDAAKVILENKIDILIDMNGYTMGGRPEIFAFRPSRVQIGFLGWPSTIGSSDILDYTLTDPMGTAVELVHRHYHEKVLLVEPSLFIGNHKEKLMLTEAQRAKYRDRSRLHIPEDAFVFSNHNQLFKISEDLLDVWSNIFRRLRTSRGNTGHVLWLLQHPEVAEKHIVSELHSRGVPHRQIIFSDFAEQEEYISRSEAANLFLDNVRYNAGATGVDQYFSNVPSVTLPGDHFVKRMGKSLAYGHGVNENIVYSLKEYEDLAVEYATNNGRASRQNYKYSGMRSHMEALKSRSDLFDTDKWISKLLNGFKGTHELNHIGGGRNPKFHYISFQSASHKSGK